MKNRLIGWTLSVEVQTLLLVVVKLGECILVHSSIMRFTLEDLLFDEDLDLGVRLENLGFNIFRFFISEIFLKLIFAQSMYHSN